MSEGASKTPVIPELVLREFEDGLHGIELIRYDDFRRRAKVFRLL
jgi:hypothetical protein